ncbi:hypothetical protein [Streptosporangium sp. G12]
MVDNGTLMVTSCKLQVGQVHRGKVVTVVLEEARFRMLFEGEELSVHPRTVIKEVNRLRASGHIDYRIWTGWKASVDIDPSIITRSFA